MSQVKMNDECVDAMVSACADLAADHINIELAIILSVDKNGGYCFRRFYPDDACKGALTIGLLEIAKAYWRKIELREINPEEGEL